MDNFLFFSEQEKGDNFFLKKNETNLSTSLENEKKNEFSFKNIFNEKTKNNLNGSKLSTQNIKLNENYYYDDILVFDNFSNFNDDLIEYKTASKDKQIKKTISFYEKESENKQDLNNELNSETNFLFLNDKTVLEKNKSLNNLPIDFNNYGYNNFFFDNYDNLEIDKIFNEKKRKKLTTEIEKTENINLENFLESNKVLENNILENKNFLENVLESVIENESFLEKKNALEIENIIENENVNALENENFLENENIFKNENIMTNMKCYSENTFNFSLVNYNDSLIKEKKKKSLKNKSEIEYKNKISVNKKSKFNENQIFEKNKEKTLINECFKNSNQLIDNLLSSNSNKLDENKNLKTDSILPKLTDQKFSHSIRNNSLKINHNLLKCSRQKNKIKKFKCEINSKNTQSNECLKLTENGENSFLMYLKNKEINCIENDNQKTYCLNSSKSSKDIMTTFYSQESHQFGWMNKDSTYKTNNFFMKVNFNESSKYFSKSMNEFECNINETFFNEVDRNYKENLEKSKNQNYKNPFSPECRIPLPGSSTNEFSIYIDNKNFVRKRNERERTRVRNVNEGFENLKKHLPVDYETFLDSNSFDYKKNSNANNKKQVHTNSKIDNKQTKNFNCSLDGSNFNSSSNSSFKEKRISKVETLRLAINYIKHLEEILEIQN